MLDKNAVRAIRLVQQEAHDRGFPYVGSESLAVGVLLEAQQRLGAVSVGRVTLERVLASVPDGLHHCRTYGWPRPVSAYTSGGESDSGGTTAPRDKGVLAGDRRADARRRTRIKPGTSRSSAPSAHTAGGEGPKAGRAASTIVGSPRTPEQILLSVTEHREEGVGLDALADACAPAPIECLRRTLQRSLQD